MRTTTTTRNEAIYYLYVEGHTLQDIADAYHMTRERVRQIIIDYARKARLPIPPASKVARIHNAQLLREALA
jgi:DNA-directed RNA polymerase sigma subunit (sigma70/sigma32)